jgi:hypothetical protein
MINVFVPFDALHSDIFLLEWTFSVIREQIRKWYGTVI